MNKVTAAASAQPCPSRHRGFLCGKVARYLEHEYSPDRLLYPLRRIGPKGEGSFARISWTEALGEIASRLQSASDDFGPESILPTATPAPSASSTTEAWIAASSTASGPRASTARSAPPLAWPA